MKGPLLTNSYLKSQSNLYTLIWVSHSSENNSLHQGCSRIACSDKQCFFTELLGKDSCVSINECVLKISAAQIYQVRIELIMSTMKEMFTTTNKNPFVLKRVFHFSRPFANTVYHGIESVSILGPQI